MLQQASLSAVCVSSLEGSPDRETEGSARSWRSNVGMAQTFVARRAAVVTARSSSSPPWVAEDVVVRRSSHWRDRQDAARLSEKADWTIDESGEFVHVASAHSPVSETVFSACSLFAA